MSRSPAPGGARREDGRKPAEERTASPPSARGLGSRLLPLLKAAVSAGLIFWIARRLDWSAVGAAVAALRWHAPLLAFLTVIAGICLWPLRLGGLLAAQAVAVRYRSLLRVTFTGLFVGNVLPTSMGGDAVKLGMLLQRHPGRKGRITFAVVADRFANVAATFLLLVAVVAVPGLIGPGLAPPAETVRLVWAALVAGPILAALTVAWLQRRFRDRHPPHGAPEGLRERLIHLAHGVLRAVLNLVAAPRAVAAALALSVASTLLFFGASRIVAAGVGVAVAPGDWVFVQCLLSVVGILPISLNGLGVQEVSVVYLLGRLGVPSEAALAYALLNRVLFIGASLPGALGWFGAGGRVRGG